MSDVIELKVEDTIKLLFDMYIEHIESQIPLLESEVMELSNQIQFEDCVFYHNPDQPNNRTKISNPKEVIILEDGPKWKVYTQKGSLLATVIGKKINVKKLIQGNGHFHHRIRRVKGKP